MAVTAQKCEGRGVDNYDDAAAVLVVVAAAAGSDGWRYNAVLPVS